MDIQIQKQGAVTVLKPVGPLVGGDAQIFSEMALEAARGSLGRIVVDASAIPFTDSHGIEALLDVTDELSRGGRALKLCAPAQTLCEVLDITGLAGAFEQFLDVTSAVRSFI